MAKYLHAIQTLCSLPKLVASIWLHVKTFNSGPQFTEQLNPKLYSRWRTDVHVLGWKIGQERDGSQGDWLVSTLRSLCCWKPAKTTSALDVSFDIIFVIFILHGHFFTSNVLKLDGFWVPHTFDLHLEFCHLDAKEFLRSQLETVSQTNATQFYTSRLKSLAVKHSPEYEPAQEWAHRLPYRRHVPSAVSPLLK